MTGYITLLLLGLLVTLLHLFFISKKYFIKLIPILWDGETKWNPKIDRLKLLISCLLLISPIFLINQLIKFNHHDDYFNYTSLIIINVLIIFSFWFSAKKVTKLKEKNSLSKFVYPDKEIKADLENLKLTGNKLKDISINTIHKVDYNNKKTNEKLNRFELKHTELEKTSTDINLKLNNNSYKNEIFEKDIESLKLKNNQLEHKTINTNSKVDNYYQEIKGIKEISKKTNQDIIDARKETKKNKSDFDEEFNEVKEKINQNKADSNNKLKETNNEISKIKYKLKPKKRDSDIRDEKINKIKSEFKILVNDLQKFKYYDDKNNVLINNLHGISELESYQILVIFFQRYYNFPEEKTNNIIYDLFNDHFSISLVNGINSGNWTNFKKKILDDIENQTFYSDLMLNHNKRHSTVE